MVISRSVPARAIGLGWAAMLLSLGPVAQARDGNARRAAAPAPVCTDLVGRDLGNDTAIIRSAAVVPATATLPEYCLATAEFGDSGLRVEVRMPTSGWNGKIAYLGGGGFNGIMPPFEIKASWSPSILRERYAVILSNGGYDGPNLDADQAAYFKAGFARDRMKLIDYFFLSVHRALPVGKAVVSGYYGRKADRAYFEGCSFGGHEAMIEAQRFPRDFDGIIARAPAANFVGELVQFNRIVRQVTSPGASLNPAKRKLLADAVLAQCDGLDGLKDGIISATGQCRFKPQALRCAGGGDTGDTCLSDAQVATVETVTAPYASRDGSITHAGFSFGGEDLDRGWGDYVWPSPVWGTNLTKAGGFSGGFIRQMVTLDPNYDIFRWDPEAWMPSLHFIGQLLQANDPDLSRFAAGNGKLILWGGEIDTASSPKQTARLYEETAAALGKDRADATLEYFPAPGVGHCGGGPGPDHVDLMKALSTWVEAGTAPSSQGLVLSKLGPDRKPVMSRPMCKYPAFPAYDGKGDANRAESFRCENPSPKE
jgi:hypothetical protein